MSAQGRDKDCILVSFVRSVESPSSCTSSLLGDWHRINVALTRAKVLTVGALTNYGKRLFFWFFKLHDIILYFGMRRIPFKNINLKMRFIPIFCKLSFSNISSSIAKTITI